MNTLCQSVLDSEKNGLDFTRLHAYEANDYREAISHLVNMGRTSLADALCEAGLSLYPEDENILAIAALMASLHEDWVRSEEYLTQLIQLHGGSGSAFTWDLLVRCLRCQLEPIEAYKQVQHALAQHPQSPELLKHQEELQSLLGDGTLLINSQLTWQ